MGLHYKRKQLLKEDLCNHCLGRQFAQVGTGLENYQRGYLIKNKEDISEEDFKQDNIPADLTPGGNCYLCQGFFNQLDKYTKLIVDTLKDYEFETILIGTKPPESLKKEEEKLWFKYGRQRTEPFKGEFNRLLAKRVMLKLDIDSDLQQPDIQAIVDLTTDDLHLNYKPVFIYGQYNKYVRDISQTIWNYSQDSVQQVIQTIFLNRFKAVETKFHGAGREDLNVRCFGKREFVLELVKPKKRSSDLEQITADLNQSQDKVEVFNLQFVEAKQKRIIKEKKAAKIYRALVQLNKDVINQDLLNLDDLKGIVKQKTPSRVLQTRGDKIRTRTIYHITAEIIASQKVELIIKAEAGTYIKEFISGDQGRTKPNIAEFFNCQAECNKLDVISIDN